jgi:hypothetical protein
MLPVGPPVFGMPSSVGCLAPRIWLLDVWRCPRKALKKPYDTAPLYDVPLLLWRSTKYYYSRSSLILFWPPADQKNALVGTVCSVYPSSKLQSTEIKCIVPILDFFGTAHTS